jgi:hypothetical protein
MKGDIASSFCENTCNQIRPLKFDAQSPNILRVSETVDHANMTGAMLQGKKEFYIVTYNF